MIGLLNPIFAFLIPLIISVIGYFILRNRIQKKVWLIVSLILIYIVSFILYMWIFVSPLIASIGM
ncbi:MAG: hypothetical protein ABIJ18_02615 [archaeon]